jgi:hypothetical protein
MRVGDLSSGASKLANAIKQLKIKWESASDGWHDVRAKAFQRDHIDPLTPRIKETLDALGRLAEVLDRAIRDVSDTQGGE